VLYDDICQACVILCCMCCCLDHMYRMGMMSLLASDCGVDATRCMKIALVHDVAEAIVGDITPHCSVSDEDKFSLESRAIQQIKSMLGPETQAGKTDDEHLASRPVCAVLADPSDAHGLGCQVRIMWAPVGLQQAGFPAGHASTCARPNPIHGTTLFQLSTTCATLTMPLLQPKRWRCCGTSMRPSQPQSHIW